MGSESSNTGEQRRIGPATLLHGEIFWHEHATWLKECGLRATTALSAWLGSIMDNHEEGAI